MIRMLWRGDEMIKTAEYRILEKNALRRKGWKLFAMVIVLQMIFLIVGYAFQI